MASDWVGKEDLISKRNDNKSVVDKTEIVTIVLDGLKLSTAHRKMKRKG